MVKKVKIHVKIIKSGKDIIANCPELDVNCYGNSKDEAVRRLVHVLQFYIDAALELGLDVEQLETVMIDGETMPATSAVEMVRHNSEAIH